MPVKDNPISYDILHTALNRILCQNTDAAWFMRRVVWIDTSWAVSAVRKLDRITPGYGSEQMKGSDLMSRIQKQKAQPTSPVFLGIDVSKADLDVFLHPVNSRLQFPNTPAGIRKLVRHRRQAMATYATVIQEGVRTSNFQDGVNGLT